MSSSTSSPSALKTPLSSSSSWSDLQAASISTKVGAALESDFKERQSGYGSPHVDNKLRLFDKDASYKPKLTLYRDRAGWCPYCEKTILLVEEKRIPIQIETVAMRSYGDKPAEFLRMVPNGLLPALVIEEEDGRRQVVTESQVIMELLDAWHPPEDGYQSMLPDKSDTENVKRYQMLVRLERELFSWWCTLIFRPEQRGGGGLGGLGNILKSGGNDNDETSMSPAMRGFIECMDLVNAALLKTPGPWFLDLPNHEGPSMIDFIFVSHIERMLASCAYWKGLQLRGTGRWKGVDAWFDAFDLRPSYLGFKSDFYTNVMDIPPQYGPGFDGGFEKNRKKFAASIRGKDGQAWKLPLLHDDTLEPLFKGPPLPLCALEAGGVSDYQNADSVAMATACRHAAAWKLASNGDNVVKFAARGGSQGAKNPRKTFAAPLADPYAAPDENALPVVDHALRIVCATLLSDEINDTSKKEVPFATLAKELKSGIPQEVKGDVVKSLEYVRDRVGVPRDMPLAAARHFRAHLNWAIDVLE